MIASQLSAHCDVISNRSWRHQQIENRASETRGRCKKVVVLSPFRVLSSFVMSCKNKMMHELSWRTVSALTRVLSWYLFHSLLRNSGNKHQNSPLVNAETGRNSSTYIILYFHGLGQFAEDMFEVYNIFVFVLHSYVTNSFLNALTDCLLMAPLIRLNETYHHRRQTHWCKHFCGGWLGGFTQLH